MSSYCVFSCFAFASALSAVSTATMFSEATHRCTRLIPDLTMAIGAQRMQISVKIPKDRGPRGTGNKQ